MKEKKAAADFWVIGINYRKADTETRGQYAVSDTQYEAILQDAPAFGVSSLFVLSTCNRTEIYGFAQQAQQLAALLCSHTEGTAAGLQGQAYIKHNDEALKHVFQVAAGLDSQILGDYEIVGQMKKAFQFSKERGCTNTFMERLFNTALQSSRAIRATTHLSGGTVSVAFAAVQFLKGLVQDLTNTRILIVGSGAMGQSACRNLVALGSREITLLNRTAAKATALADELGLRTAPLERLKEELRESDIVIVATAAVKPLFGKAELGGSVPKILIDLSVPNNIDPDLRTSEGIILANVDDLSRINDETLRKRQAEVPRAQELINTYIRDFGEWRLMQEHVPVLKAVKEKLCELNVRLAETRMEKDDHAVQKALNTMAKKMRREEQRPGCNYIETIHHYLAGQAI